MLGWQQIGECVAECTLAMAASGAGKQRWPWCGEAAAGLMPSPLSRAGQPSCDREAECDIWRIMLQGDCSGRSEVLPLVHFQYLPSTVRVRQHSIEPAPFPRRGVLR